MMTFHKTVVLVGLFVLIFTLIITFTARKNISISNPLRNFFILPLIGIIQTINTILTNVFNLYGEGFGGFFDRFIIFFDFLFWLYFFSSIGIRLIATRFHKFFLSIGLSVILIFLILFFENNKFHHYTITFFYLVEISLCLHYFNKLFSDSRKKIVVKSMVFLIVSGLLIKCALAIPTYLASEIMLVGRKSQIQLFIFPISNVGSLIMYFHIIQAFLKLRSSQTNDYHFNSEFQKI